VVTNWPLESDERGSRRSQSRCPRRPQDTSRAYRRSVSSDHVACGSFQSLGPAPLHEVEHVERHSAAAGSSAPQAALAGAVCLALVTTARTTGRCVGGHAANDCIRMATLRARTRRLDDSLRSSRSRTPSSVQAAPVAFGVMVPPWMAQVRSRSPCRPFAVPSDANLDASTRAGRYRSMQVDANFPE